MARTYEFSYHAGLTLTADLVAADDTLIDSALSATELTNGHGRYRVTDADGGNTGHMTLHRKDGNDWLPPIHYNIKATTDVQYPLEIDRALAITDARLAELDAANLPADVDAIKAETDKLVLVTAGSPSLWAHGSLADDLCSKDSNRTFSPTTDSLEAIRARLDATYTRVGAPAGASIAADIALVKVDTAGILLDTGTDGVVLTAAERNAVADAIFVRNMSNVEASAPEHSLCTIVLATLESAVSGTVWTIKRTDGSTTHFTKTLTVDAGADPITGVS